MFDLWLFRKPALDGASVAAFALPASAFSILLYLTLYLQTILGLSPLQAGLRFLPMTVAMLIASAVAGELTERVPVRLLLGSGLALVGAGLMLMRGLTASSGWSDLLVGFIVSGIGVGMVNPGLASAAIGVVTPEHSGMASGINSTFRQVGIATGIAALGAIFSLKLSSTLAHKLAGTAAQTHAGQLAHAVASGGAASVIHAAPAAQRAQAATAIRAAFAGSLNDILLVAAIVAFVAAGLALALVGQSNFVTSPAAAATPAAA